jgi:hypothetical protein
VRFVTRSRPDPSVVEVVAALRPLCECQQRMGQSNAVHGITTRFTRFAGYMSVDAPDLDPQLQ